MNSSRTDAQSAFVVADDPPLREMLGLVLREAGFHVESGAAASATLKQVRGQRPSLMLLVLPFVAAADSLALDALIPADRRALPLVLLGTDAASLTRACAVTLGRPVRMPFDVDDLLETVEQALHGSRSQCPVARSSPLLAAH